jgi:anthranilate synthase component 1
MNDAARNKTIVTPVVETMPADLLTPLAVYLKLSANSTNSFLLESVEGGRSLARYSFIGAHPIEVVSGGRDVYRSLREHFIHRFISNETPETDLPPFIGGAIGHIGFEACQWFQPSLARNGDTGGTCAFMFYRSIVAFDHAKQVIRIISLDLDGKAEAAKRNAEIRRIPG